MIEEESDLIIILQEESGQRLDKILASRFQDVKSRTYFQYLLEEGKVLVNGLPVKKRMKPEIADEIEIQWLCTPELSLNPEPIPLDIIYEDEEMIVVNKSAGMVIHPAVGNWTGTFVNALLYHCQHMQSMVTTDKKNENDLRPGIVHRLDKATSGLLVAAKTVECHQKLGTLFAERKIHKEYLAICVGKPGDRTIDKPIGRDPIHRKQMAVLHTGRQAKSICKTLSFNERLSLVQITLITGRTHQIRVHLKYCGTPVLGDPLYGNEQFNLRYGVNRQMLHAYQLRFAHPMTSQLMEFKAPLPFDMEKVLANEKLA